MNLPPKFHVIVGCNEIAMKDKMHSHILTYVETPICKPISDTHFLLVINEKILLQNRCRITYCLWPQYVM